MSITKSTTIHAAGRELTMTGTAPIYLDWHRHWNADESALLASVRDIPAGATVLDVGANIGMLCCSLAVQRPDLRIVAVEPVPDNVACLRENLAVNDIGNVEVIHAGVAEKPGALYFDSSGPWSSVQATGEGARVECITLDSLDFTNVALVKIDVEGWEPQVIAGATELLSKQRPLVLMEWNTLCLIKVHHDPMSLAQALWASFEMLDFYFEEKSFTLPNSAYELVHHNVIHHKSVSDILMRPKVGVPIPHLADMIDPPRNRSQAINSVNIGALPPRRGSLADFLKRVLAKL